MEVALQNCKDYNIDNVYDAVKAAVASLGGMEKFVFKNQTVLIKVNLLSKHAPEDAVTTHPAVVRAIAKLCLEAGAKVIIGDSPGGPFTKIFVNGVYKGCGMTDVVDEFADLGLDCSLNQNFDSAVVFFKDAVAAKKMPFIDVALKADIIINAAKLKTHGFTGYTGCVKNLFGLIAGLQKVQMHGNNTDLYKFCDHLVDIERFVKDKCKLHIMDAVVGMEGEGPSAGNPRFIGKIIASVSPYAADIVENVIMNNNPYSMPVIKNAVDRKIITNNLKDIVILGENLEKSVIIDYNTIKPNFRGNNAIIKSKFLQKFAFSLLTSRPKILRKCKGCKICFEHCPPKAITMAKSKAKINYAQCIRCFCCQELCPYKKIKIKKPIAYRLLKFK